MGAWRQDQDLEGASADGILDKPKSGEHLAPRAPLSDGTPGASP